MNQFFKDIFEYSHQVNQRLGDVFIDNSEKTSDRAAKLYSHILNAHQIWNTRIERGAATFGVWDLHPVSEFKRIDQVNYEQTLQIIDKFQLDEVISYSNKKGQALRHSVRDILFHAINHSTYHRGQIATEFKLHGLEPLLTDYILFKQ